MTAATAIFKVKSHTFGHAKQERGQRLHLHTQTLDQEGVGHFARAGRFNIESAPKKRVKYVWSRILPTAPSLAAVH